jgi:hypothetical protein
MKSVGKRVNIIPVIAKADALTPAEQASFKRNVKHAVYLNVFRGILLFYRLWKILRDIIFLFTAFLMIMMKLKLSMIKKN